MQRDLRPHHFISGSALLLIVCATLLFSGNGPQYTLLANSTHNPFADKVFATCSFLAEWPLIAMALLLGIVKNPRLGLWFGVCFLLEFAITQGLKTGIGATRPVVQFGDALRALEGNPLLKWRSFPSGHTAAAFTALGFIAMLINKTPVTILMVVVAALCAYSRMYLGQHYLLDLAGGICVAMFILVISELGKNKLLSKMSINP